MNKEDKELLLRDLCNRLPYNVMCQVEFKEDGKYNSKVMLLSGIFTDEAYFTTKDGSIYSNEYKPYLRPMSSMTEEEAKELSILCDITDVLSIKITDEYIDFEVDDGFSSIETKIIWFNDIISSIEIFDWLNKNHFDYRGLIPMGLAIAATKENNPYKK